MEVVRLLARGLLTFGLCAFLAPLSLSPVTAQAGQPMLAPANPDFADYMLDNRDVIGGQSVMRGQYSSGVVPEPVDLSHLKGARLEFDFPRAMGVIPSRYDLRALGKLTPIRNQGSCGCCWSFAAYSSLESYLLTKENWDFSENNLKNRHGFDLNPCAGGNRTMATSYLARWEGPVAESDDPYDASDYSSPAGLPVKKHVQDVIYLPTRSGPTDNDAIKEAVMAYGAVYTTYYHSNYYYRSSTRAYYYNGGYSANHAVAIVGWDDSYSRTNFSIAPPGDGAFIIRNSWGTWWGESGYFYMSYYDTKLAKTENAVFTAEPADNYDTIYQYDPYGWISGTGYGSTTAWFANIFTAAKSESIVAASWYAASPGASYEISIYLNPTTSSPIGSGPFSVTTGTLATAGYHTVDLVSPIQVTAGQKFSVVVKLNTPGYGYPVPLERPYSGYCSAATANAGESWMSSNGSSWIDIGRYYANTNVCLKAFGKGSSTPTPEPGSLSVTPTGNLSSTGYQGGPFSPSSITYTLSNTGGESINWTAGKNQSWISLSATSGTLAAGATASVVVSINSDANNLVSGNYSDTVTLTNTTNGSGNTTRAISLAIEPKATPAKMEVTPTTGLSSSGYAGGPFSPSSTSYTITNTGGESLNWTAAKTQSWLTLSATSGTIAAGGAATVNVMINSLANNLSAGSYSDTVTFVNATNGDGNTSRSVALTVQQMEADPGVLSVGPTSGLSASGSVGGPFSPSSQTYTLTNTGGETISWSVGKSQAWVSLSATNGTLYAGQSTSVTVSINSTAGNLAAGNYSDTVTFVNSTNSNGNTSRSVSLSITAGSSGEYRVESTTYDWIDPTYHSRLSLSDNSISDTRYLPFYFTLYGTTYHKLYVGSNGLMGFNPYGLYSYYNTKLPYYYYPNATIYPYWDDLNPSMGGSVYVGATGTYPNRKFVVTWVDVPHRYSSSTKFTFQAILEEGTNDIVFQYKDVNGYYSYYGGGRSATIGIEDENGKNAVLYSYNQYYAVSNGTALRFTNR